MEEDTDMQELINQTINRHIKKVEQPDENKCKRCFSTKLAKMKGNLTCLDCGCFGQNIIINTQEWRDFGNNDNHRGNPIRCGMPTNELLPNVVVSSVFNIRAGKHSYQMSRLRNMQTWGSMTYQDNTLMKSFMDMNIICNVANINPCILENAKYICKQIYLIKTQKKIKKRTLQAASVFSACKKQHVARGINEIADAFGISMREMRKGCKYVEDLSTSDNDNDSQDEETDDIQSEYMPTTSLDYIHRCCSKIGLNDEIYKICEGVCIYVEKMEFLGNHKPLSRTASCITLTCKLLGVEYNIKNVEDVCDISEVTINKCSNKLMKHINNIIKNTDLVNFINSSNSSNCKKRK